MLKRKRTASDDGEIQSKDRKLTLRATRLEQKIEHGVVLLHRALKTARGFERQKLGRRQKTAKGSKDAKALERLAAEVEALKSLDLHAAAERYLIKQLVKTKRIAESSTFAQLDESKRTLPQDGPRDGPVANVTARLFNSNPVRDALPGVMDDIRKIIGVSDDKKEKPGKKAKKETRLASEDVSGSEDSEGEEHGMDARIASDSDVSMGDDGIDHELYASRPAPSDSESGSEEEDDDERPAKSRYDLARDISLSPTPSDSDPDSPPATAQKSSKSKSKAPKEPASGTTFLPSLTMGGYWSGSESEPEEDAAASNVRKNRMGQQARRKLWEKKYGAQANHVKKQKMSNDRDSGWDLRRGAVDAQDTRGKGKGRFAKGRGLNDKPRDRGHGHTSRPVEGDRQRKPAGGRASNKPAVDNKPLHPSWEAAKKAKEKKANVAFQGKKVTFD